MTPSVASSTMKPTVAASAATPSLSVRPRATPMAKINGSAPKMAPPDCAMTFESVGGSALKCALPMPSSNPATGSTDTGSISALPIFCRNAKPPANAFMGVSRLLFGRRRRHRAHFLGAAGLERNRREIAARCKRQRAHLRLDRCDCRYAHAQLVDAEADENRHRLRIAGHAAAPAGPLAGVVGGAHGLIDQPQHRRMQRVGARGQFRMSAVHGQRVLRQVVAANREKINLPRE